MKQLLCALSLFVSLSAFGQTTPSQILSGGAAFQGLTARDLAISQTYLLAQIAQVTSTPAQIVSNASAFYGLDDKSLQIAQVYLLSQISTNGSGYTVPIITIGSASPSASTTYFFGMDGLTGTQTTYANASVKIPRSGTLKGVYVLVSITTPGSGETVSGSIRLNDATDVALPNSTWNANRVTITTTSLSQAVTVGDTFCLKIVTPAWVSAPVTLRLEGYIYIQ